MPVSELPPERLRLEVRPDSVGCETSAELSPSQGIIGQERALRALRFGVEMKGKGFNIYAAGPPITGKRPSARRFLEEVARSKPTPPDWAYVNNFENPYEPKALQFPAGRARVFQRDLKNFIDQGRRAIPAALQSEEFMARANAVTSKAEEARNRILESVNREAQAHDHAVRMSQLGVTIVPIQAGQPLSQEAFDALPASTRKKYEQNAELVRASLDRAGKEILDLEAKAAEELRRLRDGSIQYAIGGLFEALVSRYRDLPPVVEHLGAVRADILANAEMFVQGGRAREDGRDRPGNVPEGVPPDPDFRRYNINIIVDNAGVKGAPVLSDDNPTVTNLLGSIEHEAKFGALTTDFTLVKGGSLHRANGGYLILGAVELLRNELSYDGLKRCLQSGTIEIEEIGQRLGAAATKSLTPQPIPLDVKVVLVGDHSIYQALYTGDPDFSILFKVKAHFDDSIERTPTNVQAYGSFIHSLSERENLRHLEAGALAKVIEFGSRLAEDQMKLSTKLPEIADLVREANFYASEDRSRLIKDAHVRRALEERIYRSNLLDEKVKEAVARGILLIDTSGARVGQVNGLSVIGLGDFDFGQPSRITASVGLGRRGIIDIERESRLGGQIHTKGVLIISGYLEHKYAHDKPLSLSCRIVFEQSYGGVEGDSASSAELYAILSALSDVPIKQSLAVTGSVNQKGEIQAIGGVNEKIEGFYHVCKIRGLKGDEGVLIPESNVQHLMLDEEVVDAVKAGRFHIYPVRTVDEGVEVLTGVRAGALRGDGTYEPGTVHHRANERLAEMARAIAKYPEPIEVSRERPVAETEASVRRSPPA